jgi:hypothetical protein
MEKSEALQIATDYLRVKRRMKEDSIAITACERKPYGWVLHYNSKRFVETGDITYALIGNCPLVVTDGDKAVHVVGGGVDREAGLRAFERKHGF